MLHKDVQRESAIVKTIRIPELRHAILQEAWTEWLFQGDPAILKCTLVNQLWESESNQLLWEQCGEYCCDRRRPGVRHLIAMDKNRRQRYANHIRTLWLHSKHEVDDLEFGWEGRFHAKLTSLSFPILRDLSISTYPWSEEDHYAPIRNPIPYSQPLMKTLRILDLQGPGGVVICDEFLLALSSQSKNLEKLDVCIFLILSPPLSKLCRTSFGI